MAATHGPDCTTYGAGVSIERPTPLAALAAAPEGWAGKTVRVRTSRLTPSANGVCA